MKRFILANEADVFVASSADFKAGVRAGGKTFWRGVALGFLASFPIAQIAVAKELLPFLPL